MAERDERGYIRYMRPCECQRSVRIARRIWQKYAQARLSDFRAATMDAVEGWLRDSRSPGFFLFGGVGVGKTHLGAAICRALLEAGEDALMVNAAVFYRKLRAGFNSEQTEEAVMAKYCRVHWLLFDDAGGGALTDFERRTLLDLLDQRASRKTIITSNLTVEEFAQRLDERIASRLREFTSFRCGGADRRATRNRLVMVGQP